MLQKFKMEQKQIPTNNIINQLIVSAKKNPDGLNGEGKRALAVEIIEICPIGKVNKFLKEFGYEK